MEKPPRIHAHKMKAEGKGQHGAPLAPAENSRAEPLHAANLRLKSKSFLSRQGNKAEEQQRSHRATWTHQHMFALTSSLPRGNFQPAALTQRRGERIDRWECSGQLARDARRILQLNKKLNMQPWASLGSSYGNRPSSPGFRPQRVKQNKGVSVMVSWMFHVASLQDENSSDTQCFQYICKIYWIIMKAQNNVGVSCY